MYIFINLLKKYFLFCSTGLCATQNVAKHEPIFVTRSETFKFVAGETIQLPCEVSNAGKLFNKIVFYF